MDDTLIEWTVHWRDAFAQAAAGAGVTVSPDHAFEAILTAFSTFYRDCVREHASERDDRAFWLDYDARILASLGVTNGLQRATEQVVGALTQPGTRRLYPEALEVLEGLTAGGARLGIVTGRPLAEPDLVALGIRHYFAPLIDAFTARSSKSEGLMFKLAASVAADAGLPAWHVGDSHADDVLGARAAGLSPILVDRRREHAAADCPRIANLRELLDIIPER
jgi:putative hydrolase of the HAD superfamily